MDPYIPLWKEILPSAVVPVVIISACGLLCLAFYNRLASIVSRLRSLQRERLGEYRALFQMEERKRPEYMRQEAEQFLHFLEHQTADVMKRARFLQCSICCLIYCIFSLVLTSLLIGASLYYPAFDFLVLFFFVLSLILLLVSLIYALKEIRIALNPIQMESGFVQELIRAQLRQNV